MAILVICNNTLPTSTLPLIYNSFEVRENSNGALLQWVVSQVVNHSHFEIERSVDGINFEKIFTELKILSNNNQHALSFTDNNLPNSSVVFYRIKQVEKSGTYNYSAQKSIKVKSFKISLYSVPAIDFIYFDLSSDKRSSGKIIIMDASGQMVIIEDRKIMTGKNIIQVDIKRLPKGTYTLIFENNESQQLGQQFIKL